MRITYYGHSCFLLTIKDKHILFDPFISGNELAKEIDIHSIPADYILVSHGHSDHTLDLVAIAKRTQATVVCIWEIHAWLNKNGIPKTHPLNIGGSRTFDFGTVKMVSAVHSSSLPDGTYAGNPAGFYITAGDQKFYYSGDTALHYDMKLLGKHHSVDFAFLPIGDNFTMGIDDAVIASKYIKCDTVIGMHFDTFGYIKINREEAKKKFADQDKKLYLMEVGETMEL